MVVSQTESSSAVGPTPRHALREAVAALTEGRHDPRLAEGAQANALESIAWSLIGLLARETERDATPEAGTPVANLSQDLERLGFLRPKA